MPEHLAHWDEVETERHSQGAFRSAWTDLGTAAGSVTVGVNRVQVEPEARSTPLHMEGSEEEIFFVLGGSGRSWQYDGEVEATFEIRAGDCLVHRASHEAHSVVAGPDGIDYLAFGMRATAEYALFPRLKGGRVGMLWADEIDMHQWQKELALGDPELPQPSARPDRIVNLDDVEPTPFGQGEAVQAIRRDLGRAAGSALIGLKHVTVEPGKLACPAHCHSAEEEIFVVLEGEGVCILDEHEYPVRRGHVLGRPAGTGIAHTFRAGDGGFTYLAYGTREPNDIAYYPSSNKVSLRGVGVIARLERLDYWDGEEG
jgi:uncharacterized cupin superfamily protein